MNRFSTDRIIEVKNLKKSFYLKNWRTLILRKKAIRVDALRGVSICVKQGQVLGLLGPNGAGKTTLIKILATLVLPDSGYVYISGHNVLKEPESVREKIGLVNTNERSFYWRLTGEQNLSFFAKLYNLHGKLRKQRVNELLEFVGLFKESKSSFMTYSTGQRQRLAIARSLLNEPDVLLFDEPTSSLDPIGSVELISFVKDNISRNKNKAVIWCTHDLNEAERVSDQVVIINQGKVIIQGDLAKIKCELGNKSICRIKTQNTAEDVFDQLAFKATIVDRSINRLVLDVAINEESIPDLIMDLKRLGVDIYSCGMKEPSLEAIFTDTVKNKYDKDH